jgi:hypothetical protein
MGIKKVGYLVKGAVYPDEAQMNAGEKLKLKEDNEFLFNNLCMVMDEKTMMKIQVHDGDGWEGNI